MTPCYYHLHGRRTCKQEAKQTALRRKLPGCRGGIGNEAVQRSQLTTQTQIVSESAKTLGRSPDSVWKLSELVWQSSRRSAQQASELGEIARAVVSDRHRAPSGAF